MTYKVGPKGQVVLPKAVRDRLGIGPGDQVMVDEDHGAIRIRKVITDPVERRAIVASLRGALAGAPSPTAALEEDRRLEREREERKYQEWHTDSCA